MFSIAKKAASRLRFANIFNRAIGLTTNADNAAVQQFPSSGSTPSTRRNARSRRRRSPYVTDNSTGNAGLAPSSRVLNNLRDQYRGATEVRTRVRRHNELRKQRSLQRALRAENYAAASPPTGSSTAREFHVLAGNVQQALVRSEGPKTREDLIFERGLAELVGDFVAARKVVDVEFAKEVASTFDQIDEEDFMVQLEEERARVELAMAAKEEEEQRQREERREQEEEQRQKELEELRVINQSRIREAKEQRAEARRKEAKLAEERIAEERVGRLQARLREERRLRDQERQARVEAERIARLEHERVARLEEEARLAREREEQRLRDEEQARAWMEAEAAKLDAELRAAAEEQARREAHARAEQQAQWQREADEHARRRLDEYVQSILDPEMREGINQRFQAQEDHLRARLAEAAMPEQWFYVQPEHYCHQQQQSQDIPMQDPDISMDSIPPEEPLAPQFILPVSDRDWFDLYESRWQDLRGSNFGDQLTFPSFPWPVFQFLGSLDELDDTEIKRFFTSKYPGKLDKNWKVELTRWHPDKVERVRSRIRPECVQSVREGFLRCAKVMNAFQEDKESERT